MNNHLYYITAEELYYPGTIQMLSKCLRQLPENIHFKP